MCYTKNYNHIFTLFSQANGQASLGKYAAGSVVGQAADVGLFVKNHAY